AVDAEAYDSSTQTSDHHQFYQEGVDCGSAHATIGVPTASGRACLIAVAHAWQLKGNAISSGGDADHNAGADTDVNPGDTYTIARGGSDPGAGASVSLVLRVWGTGAITGGRASWGYSMQATECQDGSCGAVGGGADFLHERANGAHDIY